MSNDIIEMYYHNSYIYSLTSKYIFYTIKGMRYTFAQFKSDFPDNDSCLELIFLNRYGDLKFCPKCAAQTKFYKVKKRQCYACMHCGHQLHPLSKTIYRKSSTPLWNWFYAIYLFSVSKNGVSAKELERHLGVTYKCAWRMAKQIRLLMQQDTDMLSGIVEADETWVGGKRAGGSPRHLDNKTAVIGIAERRGGARAIVAHPSASTALPFLRANVEGGSIVHTDESSIYTRVKRDFQHEFVNHGRKQYVKGNVHTNSIEGFWGQMKGSINGTYHMVSPKYLQSYVNEFVFRYNYRDVPICLLLLERAAKPV